MRRDSPRWLVVNKVDLLSEEQIAEGIERVREALDWDGPVYQISGLSNIGTDALCKEIIAYLETLPKPQDTRL